ncbi:hypothetical protein HUJ05_009590 [Dendroctonus ponderosae]|nr:hypothetical protein HUJ05_009590 [Dendroctonus ponderosae]
MKERSQNMILSYCGQESIQFGFGNRDKSRIGSKMDEAEREIGQHGLGERNERGTASIEFLHHNNMYAMNTFFQKNNNSITKNEHGNRRDIVSDVDALNRSSTGSDHRIRREMTAEYRNINIEITKEMRKHKREKSRIEENRSLKAIRKKNVIWKKEIHKIKNKNGDLMTIQRDIITTIETFCKQLYSTPNNELNPNIPKLLNQGKEDIPEIDEAEIMAALKSM